MCFVGPFTSLEVDKLTFFCTVPNHIQKSLKALCTEKKPAGPPEQANCNSGKEKINSRNRPRLKNNKNRGGAGGVTCLIVLPLTCFGREGAGAPVTQVSPVSF